MLYNTLHAMHEIILADIIIATAGNKRGCYFTVYIAFCDYIRNSLKSHALPHANTVSEGFTIQYMKTIPNVS